MSLRDKFKTDPEASKNGVWIDFHDAPNQDKTIPGFLVARLAMTNPKYAACMQRVAELREAAGGVLSPDEEEKNGLETFCDAIVLGWRNVQPEDDGNNVNYNRANAMKLFGDPAWFDLMAEVRMRAFDRTNYRAKVLDKAVKN